MCSMSRLELTLHWLLGPMGINDVLLCCLSMRQSLADPLPLIVHCAEEHNMLCIAASLSSLLAVVIEPFFL